MTVGEVTCDNGWTCINTKIAPKGAKRIAMLRVAFCFYRAVIYEMVSYILRLWIVLYCCFYKKQTNILL